MAPHTTAVLPVVYAWVFNLFFIGPTRFTEQISLSRYPEYALYQKESSAIIPWR